MIEVVYGQNEVVAKFVAAAMKDPAFQRGFDVCTTLGASLNGDLVGGVVFHDYSPENGVIEMSGAAVEPRWLTRNMLRSIFNYVFEQIGCQAVVMRVREDNERMIGIARKFGFNGVLVPRLAGRNAGMWIFTLFDDQWRDHPVNRRS